MQTKLEYFSYCYVLYQNICICLKMFYVDNFFHKLKNDIQISVY